MVSTRIMRDEAEIGGDLYCSDINGFFDHTAGFYCKPAIISINFVEIHLLVRVRLQYRVKLFLGCSFSLDNFKALEIWHVYHRNGAHRLVSHFKNSGAIRLSDSVIRKAQRAEHCFPPIIVLLVSLVVSRPIQSRLYELYDHRFGVPVGTKKLNV